jgi:hypothetical protein
MDFAINACSIFNPETKRAFSYFGLDYKTHPFYNNQPVFTYKGVEYKGYWGIRDLNIAYPTLFGDINNYVAEQRRAQARTAVINTGNVLLERYMQRAMHPDNFKALIADPDIDVDTFMEAYVAAL